MTTEKELLKHIMNGTKAVNEKYSLERILKAYKMDMYFKLCSERIADAELIDGEHIQIDFLNFPDLLLDNEGIQECFDILSGYVDEDELIALWRYARSNDKITECTNDQLEMLRKSSIKELFNMGFRISKLKQELWKIGSPEVYTDDRIKWASKMSRAELFSRNVFNKARIFIEEHLGTLYVQIRFWRIFRLIKNCARDLEE